MQLYQMTKTTMKTALLQTLTSPPTIFWKLKEWIEWSMKLNNVKLKEWTLKLKEWTQTIK